MTPSEVRLLRTRLVVLTVVLVTFWSYAAYLTSQDALDLLRVRALADTLGQPIDRLILSLQAERRASAETLAGAGPTATALVGPREVTDRAAGELRRFAAGRDIRLLTAGEVRDRADELIRRLDGLSTIRSQVDAGQLDRAAAADRYDQVVDVAFRVYGPEWGAYESRLAADSRAVIALAGARELLAREDTLVSAALAAQRLDPDDRRRLTELVDNQRFARTAAAAGLPADGPDEYQRIASGPQFAGLIALEDRLVRADTANALAGTTRAGWRAAADTALGALQTLVTSTARSSVERATPGAAVVVARTGAVVGLGLIVVLVLLLNWASTVRRLTAELTRPVVDAPVPAPDAGAEPAGPDREVGAEPDRPDRELFLRVTRRNQRLLRDQLDLLDGMQRRERSAEESSELFQLDHLATRVRRNVEKLIALAGARPARRWRRSVPLLDVARGAVAEVPDYHRVLIAPHWPWSLAGPAVTDVVHLLAELIENALACSPADTTVRVSGEPRAQGCAVLVVDDGPGLDAAALADANDLLARPPAAAPDGPTGLYTVAVLAHRCGAHVSLRPSRRGGTAAVVLLPAHLVPVPDTDRRPSAAPPTPYPPAQQSTNRPAPSGDGALPTRVRQTGPTGPEPGRTGLDTVEIPVARAARRHP
ncbi:nitrate- and nitrite sensing domain-containing protein [Micromonospora sp. NPDC049047]|uniref:nitrate- and nitrite sensing domain-containing protein n=1 Tax=Micromonospora sp. NPDC049047 TaxID=3155645 RepID=UPI0033DA075B